MHILRFTFVAGITVLSFSCLSAMTTPVQAEDPSSAPTTEQKGDPESSTSATDAKTTDVTKTDGAPPSVSTEAGGSGKVLQGSVKGTAIPLEEGLSKIAVAGQMVQESCMQIMKESTRKDTIVMRGPNVLPGGVVIPALGGIGGVMQMGEMPIRRDRLVRYLNQSEETLKALQTYVDALIIPADNGAAQAVYTELRTSMQTADESFAQLKELSSMKRLTNTKIGRAALNIHDAMSAIERHRADLAKMFFYATIEEGAPPKAKSE